MTLQRRAPNNHPRIACTTFDNSHKDHRDRHRHSPKTGAGARSHLHNFHTTRHDQCINSIHVTGRSEEGRNWPAVHCGSPSQSWPSSTSLAMLPQHKLPKLTWWQPRVWHKKRRNRYPSRRMLVCTLHTTTSFHHQSLIAPLSKHTQHTLSHHPFEWPIHGNKMFIFPLTSFVSSILLVSSICAFVLFSFLLWCIIGRHMYFCTLFPTHLTLIGFAPCKAVQFLVRDGSIDHPKFGHRLVLARRNSGTFPFDEAFDWFELGNKSATCFNCQQSPISVLDVSYHVLLNIARTDMSGISMVLFNHQGTHLDHIMSSSCSWWCTASSSFFFLCTMSLLRRSVFSTPYTCLHSIALSSAPQSRKTATSACWISRSFTSKKMLHVHATSYPQPAQSTSWSLVFAAAQTPVPCHSTF